jgi:hypothetical protein
LAGSLAAAIVGLAATTVAELNDWWRVPVVQAASDRAVILAGLAISMTPGWSSLPAWPRCSPSPSPTFSGSWSVTE